MDGPAGKTERDSASGDYVRPLGSNFGLPKVGLIVPKMPDKEVTFGQSGEGQVLLPPLPESE